MTSFFSWNMRGFNMPCKHRAVRSWIQAEHPLFGSLIETRVHEGKSKNCLEAAMPQWQFINNYEFHPLGRISFC